MFWTEKYHDYHEEIVKKEGFVEADFFLVFFWSDLIMLLYEFLNQLGEVPNFV